MIPLSALSSIPALGDALEGDALETEAEEARREFLLRRRGKFTSSQKMRLLSSGASDIKATIEGERGAWSVVIGGETKFTSKTQQQAKEWLSDYKEVHGRGMLSAGAKTYCKEVFVERNTALREFDSFVSFAMQRGIDKEKEAVAAFIAATGFDVYAAGDNQEFLESEHGYCGGTPDGLIKAAPGVKKAILEAKSPNSVTHYEYMQIKDGATLKEVEPLYYWQMQSNISLYGDDCEGGWFISFDDGWDKSEDHLHYCWIERNQPDIDFMIMKENLAIEYVIQLQCDFDK
jgi:hypothetical protein